MPGYDVEAMLGFGATGEVWRAREQATGQVVALKRLREGADPVALERLRREATLLRTLDTPYVVRLRDVVGDVLVLDHAAGGSLAALLTRRGCLEPGEVVTVAVPLASALACAHAVGLVHGDVSPANVLFTAEGMPLLADLGVARVAGEDLATVDGTAEYVDPVVAAGGAPDAPADVWALAALCHHLLAGTPPHDGRTVAEVLGAAVAGERAPLGLLAPSAPRALVAAVEAGLVADPAARPDAAAFASLLRRSHATAPVRLTSAAPVYAPARETHLLRAAAGAHVAGARTSRRHLAALLRPVARVSTAGRGAGDRLPRRLLPLLGLGVLVLATAGVGWASGRGSLSAAAVAPLTTTVASPTPTAPAPPSAAARTPRPGALPDPAPGPAAPVMAGPAAEVGAWTDRLLALDDARARAFSTADPAALEQVWVPGSAGLAADRAAVEQLRAAGRRALGLRHELREVTILTADPTAARVRTVDVLAEHEVVDASGAVVRQVALRGSTAWTVELTRTPTGWRLASVSPVT